MKHYLIAIFTLVSAEQSFCMFPVAKILKTVAGIGAGAAIYQEYKEITFNDYVNATTTIGNKELTFRDILQLPHAERLEAVISLNVSNDADELTKNNKILANMMDYLNTFSDEEDFITRVNEFITQEAPFDINAVAGMNSSPFYNESLLHKAAAQNSPVLVKFLLDHGASIDALDGQNWTPLHHAVHNGCDESVNELLKQNANKYAKDTSGRTPIDLSKRVVGAPGSRGREKSISIKKMLQEDYSRILQTE